MKRLLSLLLFISFLIIAIFLLFSGIESHVQKWAGLSHTKLSYSIISFILLVSDVILPIPSSLLMIVNGKILGVFLGSCLSFAANTVASVIGFYLGRKSTRVVNKFFKEREITSSNKFFNQYGTLSISVSKFIPILSETISFISGLSNISMKKFILYSTIGNLLVSGLYAFVGHLAMSYNSNLLSGVIIGAILVVTWIIHLVVQKKAKENS